MSEQISGFIERVTFHNSENGFSVLKVKLKGVRDLTSVVGSVTSPSAGEWFEAEGLWFQDKKFGKQFKASDIKTRAPTNAYGIEKYLSSGIIKGIRESTARKLVKAFGKNVFDVFDNNPERILTVDGITKKQAERIINSWAELRSIRTLIEFLCEHGITPAQALRIHRRYHNEAIDKIKNNPYGLVYDIRGIGFATADRIAQSLGIDRNSPLRARAGLVFVLFEAQDDGHCGLPIHELIALTQKMLDVDISIIEEALETEVYASRLMRGLVDQQECIFSSKLYKFEEGIAHRLQTLSKGEVPWGEVDVDKSLDWIGENHNIELSASQQEAFRQVLTSKVMIITGGPGVGKTTLIRSLLAILDKSKCTVILGAPTGRAAKRMAEVTGKEAKTLHRVLEINALGGEFQRNADKPLECDLIIVDEMSMVDVPLFNSLLEAIPKHAALLLVGDSDQLPSVGPGQVLGDMIRSNFLPAVHLKEVFRQAAQSKIISVAHAINQGELPQLQGHGRDSDFFFIETADPAQALEQIVDIATRRLPERLNLCPLTDIQILAPMGRGFVGTKSLNERLQQVLNPPQPNGLTRNGYVFSANDKVMQIRNNYNKDVYNGDIGVIHSINFEDETLMITYDTRNVEYDFSELEDVILSYAITIHKSQGSEYPVVIIPVVREHYVMLQKNLIYTAITRGKSLVILVGEKQALSIAVQNNRARRRWTLLADRLRGFC